MEKYIGYGFGAFWFIMTVISLMLHDPTTVDPELEKLWRDNF
jgi:hypothetical protein